ncbi:MAG: alpha/beta hydrolase family protein [Candidatus Limnocylindria bacterium]
MGRKRRIGLVILAIVVVLVAWEPTRVALQTAVMLPNLLDAGPKPLGLFSEEPRRQSLPYRATDDSAEPDLAELWLPAWASAERPAGAMLLVFGVNNLGRNHPAIVRVADGLARTGVAVLVPDSRTLLEGRLEVGEIDGVVRAFEALAVRPEVDRERVGIVGFSVGGSLALLAARDERISERVRWVNAFGAFADARTYLASVSAHAYRGADGAEVPWTPTPLAREVFLRFMLDQVSEPDRGALDAAFGQAILDGDRPAPDPDLRVALGTDGAQAVHDLMTAPNLEAARSAIDALPSRARAFIDAISPVRHLDGLTADVHLMHETEDHHVPFVESRALASALESRSLLAEHTEFRLFDHVQPDDLDLLAAAPELVKLLLHVRTLMEETL